MLTQYGYLAVAGFLFLEDFGVPVPGETILIAAAVYAGAGRLNILAVAVIAFFAAVAGDNVGLAIGHFGGRPLVLRLGRYVGITGERLDKAETWFNRHGGKVVSIARFVEGLRQANGVVAGVTRMHWLKFLTYNALGAALWVGVWTTVGDVSGSHIDRVYSLVSRVFLYLVVAIIVAVVARIVIRRRRNPDPAAVAAAHAPEAPEPAPTRRRQVGSTPPETAGALPVGHLP